MAGLREDGPAVLILPRGNGLAAVQAAKAVAHECMKPRSGGSDHSLAQDDAVHALGDLCISAGYHRPIPGRRNRTASVGHEGFDREAVVECEADLSVDGRTLDPAAPQVAAVDGARAADAGAEFERLCPSLSD